MTDATYAMKTLKPAAIAYVKSRITDANQANANKVIALLEGASVEQWMTAYKRVGLVAAHLMQEVVTMQRLATDGK